MPWSITADVEELVEAAGGFLSSRPVEHSPLLTEVDHLRRHPERAANQQFGWWIDAAGSVAGVFVQAPRHPPILTPLPVGAVEGLVGVLPVDSGIGCDVTTVDAVVEAWERAGVLLVPRHRLVVHRLDVLRPPPPIPGRSRLAGEADAPMLHRWFDELMADDPICRAER